jgi:hypothetical protein
MVRHCQSQVGATHGASGDAQPFKSLRTGDFMDQMAINEDQASAVIPLFDDMGVPDFFI